LEKDGELVEAEHLGLKGIGAVHDQYKKKKKQVNESRQAR
jgi:hypothetical protein